MPDYETMYFKLAAKIADAIELLDALSVSLKAAQRKTEEMYITDDNHPCDAE